MSSAREQLKELRKRLATVTDRDSLEFVAAMRRRSYDDAIELQESLSARYRGRERHIERDRELEEFEEAVLDESGKVNWDAPEMLLARWRDALRAKRDGNWPTPDAVKAMAARNESVRRLQEMMRPQFEWLDAHPELAKQQIQES